MTITAGSELKVPATTATVAGPNLNHAVGLTSTLAIAFFVDEDGDSQVDIKVQLIDITGTSAALNGASKINLRSNLSGASNMVAWGCRLSDTAALYVYRYRLSGETDYTEIAQVFTVSGSTITANAATTIRTTSSVSSSHSWKVVALTSTKAMWVYWRYDSGTDVYTLHAAVLSISGTSVTVESAATIYTSPAGPTRTPTTSRYDLVNASSSTAVVQYTELDSGGSGFYQIYAAVLSAPSTTTTVGSAANMSDNDSNDASNEDQHWVARLGDNTVASYTIDDSAPDNAYQILTLSGTSISIGTVSRPTQTFDSDSPATGFESDLILAYDRGTSTANDEAVEFTGITTTVPAALATLSWTPTNRPTRQTALVGAANPTVITSANTTSAPTGHLYVRVYRTDASPTPPAASTASFRFLGMAADSEYLIVTGLKDDATLQLYRYDHATLNEGGTPTFGSATSADIDAGSINLRPVWKFGFDGVFYAYGRDGNNVQLQRNTTGGTGSWSSIGPGTATWATTKIASAAMPHALNPNDIIVTFRDDDVYRTRDEGAAWVKQGDALTGVRVAARHPVFGDRIIMGGTASGTVLFSHNAGQSSKARGGTVLAGTIQHFGIIY